MLLEANVLPHLDSTLSCAEFSESFRREGRFAYLENVLSVDQERGESSNFEIWNIQKILIFDPICTNSPPVITMLRTCSLK